MLRVGLHESSCLVPALISSDQEAQTTMGYILCNLSSHFTNVEVCTCSHCIHLYLKEVTGRVDQALSHSITSGVFPILSLSQQGILPFLYEFTFRPTHDDGVVHHCLHSRLERDGPVIWDYLIRSFQAVL